ncbi:NADPH-dependent FMN reductase [Bacillus sonorensis]|uniref:NADPH-dependent FMN reductase n=1 Tax=Bacillus sonorensis TaxID=119858 RepID=UPI00227EAEED|nr:NAD(P)H-dependent oxidoreductase [Bacillus sonorensis]MCY8034910.1 NAD(P)H-dependent oxidoreductase [Bacillus sonorensis]
MSAKVLGLLGSLRSPSKTEEALRICLKAAERRGCTASIFDGRITPLEFCDGRDEEDTYVEGVALLREKVREAHAIVIASPEYSGSYSAFAKNMIDFLGPDYLQGKWAGVIGVAAGNSAANTVAHLTAILTRNGCWLVPTPVELPASHTIFSQHASSPTAKHLVSLLNALGENIAFSVNQIELNRVQYENHTSQ